MPRSHALLAGLFDYAGFFPPASLPLDATLGHYARYRSGRHGWMLGRLVLPVVELDAVTRAAHHLPAGDGAVPWRLSALAGEDPATDAERVDAFNRQHATATATAVAVVDTIEVRTPSVEAVRAARTWASRGFEVYCEVPLGADMDRVLDAVAHAGLHAKLRTGGVTRESIPSLDDIAAFLCGCVARGVVAKATAGLHHAVTGEHPLWEGEPTRARMLGFLNLVLGAGIAEGAGRAAALSADLAATVTRLLEVTGPPFWVGHAQVEWGGPHGPIIEGPLDQFAVSGRALIRSIGTCSFEEPVEDARRIGLVTS